MIDKNNTSPNICIYTHEYVININTYDIKYFVCIICTKYKYIKSWYKYIKSCKKLDIDV